MIRIAKLKCRKHVLCYPHYVIQPATLCTMWWHQSEKHNPGKIVTQIKSCIPFLIVFLAPLCLSSHHILQFLMHNGCWLSLFSFFYPFFLWFFSIFRLCLSFTFLCPICSCLLILFCRVFWKTACMITCAFRVDRRVAGAVSRSFSSYFFTSIALLIRYQDSHKHHPGTLYRLWAWALPRSPSPSAPTPFWPCLLENKSGHLSPFRSSASTISSRPNSTGPSIAKSVPVSPLLMIE